MLDEITEGVASLGLYVMRIVTLNDLGEALRPTPSFRRCEFIERLGDDLTLPLVVCEVSNFAFADLDNEDHRCSKVHRSHRTCQEEKVWPSGHLHTNKPVKYRYIECYWLAIWLATWSPDLTTWSHGQVFPLWASLTI